MKVIIYGPPKMSDNIAVLVSDAFTASNLTLDSISELVAGDSIFDKAVLKAFPNIKQKTFKVDWKDIKRVGATVKENKFGKYNAKAAAFRDADMLDYIKENDGMVLIIEQNSETNAFKKLATEAGVNLITVNLHICASKEPLYRL